MSEGKLDEVWDPVIAARMKMTADQKHDMERAEAWQYFLAGGGGDPFYFDYQTAIRTMRDR